MQLQLPKNVLSGMFEHALRDFPDECCGFLYGSEEGGRRILSLEPAPNRREGDKRRRFTIDPLDYLKAERRAEALGTTLLGIYHSHPLHPAIASEHDRLQAVPYFSYVIVSVFPDHVAEVRSWRMPDDSDQFMEEIIHH